MRQPHGCVSQCTRAGGFTYIGLLIAVVVLGLALAGAGIVWRTQAQREREQELLFIGREFRAAIASYYDSGHQYPEGIEDLLEDKRGPEPRHHLRRFYADPMTGSQDWTLIRTAIPGITGVTGIASSAQALPIKKEGFEPGEEAFKDAKCYCDWQFVYMPRTGRRRAGAAQPAAD
ncbi:MAG: type II secretion system GspH family protein [Pseudomonadota bacterium]|nr:type II secretion system GspH family protein [Pseudomonadota bacterium]